MHDLILRGRITFKVINNRNWNIQIRMVGISGLSNVFIGRLTCGSSSTELSVDLLSFKSIRQQAKLNIQDIWIVCFIDNRMIYNNMNYPTPGCENQWIWAVVSKGVDTTGPNLHIGYNTLICISVARRACVFMAFMPYLTTLDLLLMPKVNGLYRLYDSFNNPLLYWLHNAVCSKYSLDKITKREIIKRLFCHVTHGDMTSHLDITWQRGKTIAKHLFTSVWKLANGMAQNHISGVNLSVLYA